MNSPSSFPLSWPAHRPRTSRAARKDGNFKRKDQRGWMVPVTMAVAVERLDSELTKMGASYPLLSTNVEVRLDGKPRSGQGAPADPGVCVYFSLKGEPFALACDTFNTVEQNVAALAAHVEATRAITRWGVASAAETLQAFTALPPPPPGAAPAQPARPWWETFGVMRDAADAETITALYRVKAKGSAGNEAALLELNLAKDAALAEIGGR